MDLKKLFEPERVAVICDTRQSEDPGRTILANLQAGGYGGELVVVDPQADELAGLRCLRDPRDHPERIDLALVTCAPADLKRSVDRAVMAGARCVVVSTPLDQQARSDGLAQQLRTVCANRSARLIGPGSPGVLNPHHHLNATCAPAGLSPGGAALISESSALALALLDLAAQANLGVSKAVGLGDKADLDEVDLFAALGADPQTQLVVAAVEGIADGDAFLKRAEALASLKPVVVLKAGSTGLGSRAALVHSGRAAAADIAYGAAFRRAGVIRVGSFQELFDLARSLAAQPLPAGERVAVVTDAGGPGILVADAIERAGLTLAELGGELAVEANPLELPPKATPEQVVTAVRAVQAQAAVDAVLVSLAPAMGCPADRPVQVARSLAPLARGDKPLVAVVLGGASVEPARQALDASGVPHFPTPARAVAVLEAMRTYGAWCDRPARVITRFRVNRRRVERILKHHERQGLTQVQEHLARELVAAYDFHVPEGRLVRTADEAVEVADTLGYPVRLAAVAQDVPDRAALGGERDGLADSAAVRDAFDLIHLRLERALPGIALQGVLVERTAPAGLRVVVAMLRDPEFGPLLKFGLAGVAVEAMQDVAFHLAPITADEARQMLRSTRAYRLLEERRAGPGPARDLDAIVVALQRISQLATDFPAIQALELNPFVVTPPGTEPLVVGARITLAGG